MIVTTDDARQPASTTVSFDMQSAQVVIVTPPTMLMQPAVVLSMSIGEAVEIAAGVLAVLANANAMLIAKAKTDLPARWCDSTGPAAPDPDSGGGS
ncbi:MAG: hypothetical protein Q7V57_11095 [Actinomycetota bacterium]|nr:hypothetical protein [Actinomycetota bacterium]